MTDFTTTFRRTTYSKISPASNSQEGRTVLVTGSSEGIGYSIADAFAEARASTIILLSRSQEKLDLAAARLTERFPTTITLTRSCDVASISDCQNVFTSLADDGITVDVLVLNAGATEQPTTIDQTISNLQFAMGSNVVLTEAFHAQPNPSARPRSLINMSSAGMHCYPGIGESLPYLRSAVCPVDEAGADVEGTGRQTIYHAGKAGFAAYVAHVTEMIPESEMRIVSLFVYPKIHSPAPFAILTIPIVDTPAASSPAPPSAPQQAIPALPSSPSGTTRHSRRTWHSGSRDRKQHSCMDGSSGRTGTWRSCCG